MRTLRAVIPWLLIVSSPMVMLYPLWSRPVSAGEDDLMWFYPTGKMVGAAIREGRWPVRDALEAGGPPIMADPQAAVMYPLTWLFAVMDSKTAYSLSIFTAFSLAGAGAYLYLRRLGLLRGAAVFGAVAFMFSGFMVGHRVHLSLIHTAAFLPWGLWCIEDLSRRPIRAFAFMTPIAAAAITSGHWPTMIQMGTVWGVYLLLRARPLGRSIAAAGAAAVLAAAIAAPQIISTATVMAGATRRHIGYATAGENSFFPLAAILAIFPLLMGCRTANFFPQPWWGPWHLCEMLGYVGLITLVLAGAAVWRIYPKRQPSSAVQPGHNSIVRVWTWLAIGAGVWMLGYYLPTYRLIYMLPVLGVVRCPARMVLAVEMALATLAAVSVHAIADNGAAGRLRQTVRRGATVMLPAAMLAVLLALAAGAWAMTVFVPQKPGSLQFFAGWAQEALQAVRPANPAVWVPLVLMLATAAAVPFWLHRPGRRVGALIVILLADLFFITRFVDILPAGAPMQNPDRSPAATWLNENAPQEFYRIWGLGRSYCDRPAELLLPRTANGMGFATLAGYDPLHSAAHAHMFGFNALGRTRRWAWLIRTNRLLSLYNVRYILAADRQFREVIESVATARKAPAPDGPNLLSTEWDMPNARLVQGVLQLRTPVMWRWALARQKVNLVPGEIYRIRLDARAKGQAANFLRAEFFQKFHDGRYFTSEQLGLTVITSEMSGAWRHFEATFQAPADLSGQVLFRIFTMSERPIEARNISLRRSHLDVPVNLRRRLKPGQKVYRKVAELEPLNAADPAVAIYENLLCRPGRATDGKMATPRLIEQFKWAGHQGGEKPPLPELSVPPGPDPTRSLLAITLPAVALYILLAAAGSIIKQRKDFRGARRTFRHLCS